MVAMSGAIMPEPLAMPLSVTVWPPISACRVAPLGKVSVVMIARAAAGQDSGARSRSSAPSAPIRRSSGSGSPITPVEATKTSVLRQPKSAAVAATVPATDRIPTAPVKAFALPELITTARARRPLSALRHHCTGAPAVSERVNTPAAEVPGASSIRQTSLRAL